MMRVLVVSRPPSHMRGYGVERYTDELLTALSEAGVDVKFIGDWKVAGWLAGKVPSQGSGISSLLYDIIMPIFFVITRWSRTSDIIHFVDVANAFPSIVLAKIINPRIVVSVQSLNGISYLMTDPRGESMGDRLYRIYRAVSMKLVERFASTIFAMSTLEMEEIRRISGSSNVVVVHPSCSLPPRDPQALSGDGLVLGCVGALAPAKRIERAINILAMLRARGAESRLLVVGTGYVFDRLKEHAVKAGMAPYVDFVGHVSAGIDRFYSEMDFLLFSSVRESFGHPIVEAARSGVVCISFSDSMLSPEVRELTQPVRDEKEAAELILSLWRKPQGYARIARSAGARAAAFSPNRISSDLLDSYRSA